MKKLFFLIFIVSVFVGVGGFYFYIKINSNENKVKIFDYDKKLDRQDVLKILRDNFYWLVAGMSWEEFNFEKQIDENKYIHNPENKNLEMKIKVIRDDVLKKTVAFLTHYVQEDKVMRAHLLCVDKDYRRKGYAEILMKYLIDESRKNGFEKLFLVTRAENIRAQGLYKKLGFYVMPEEDDSHVYFLYDL
jgi:ribosomal protein S18 acetylase RimI-like enzyme